MTQLALRQVAKVDLDALLYPFQKAGAAYLRPKTAALLADQMGLGKTIQAIAAIRPDEGAVVVAPSSLLRNWKYELGRFRPDLAVVTDPPDPYYLPHPGEVRTVGYARLPRCSLDGAILGIGTRPDLLVLSVKGPAEAAGIRPGDSLHAIDGVLVGTADNVKIALAEAQTDLPTPIEVRREGKLLSFAVTLTPKPATDFARWLGPKPRAPFTLIADEAHFVKNPHATRTRRFIAFASAAARVWALTGTPLLNRPPELWALLQACKWSGRQVFGSWDEMVEMFNGKPGWFGGYKWGDPKPIVRERLDAFMLRRTREEVLPELPTKTRREVEVPITKTGILGQDFRFIDGWTDEKVVAESEEGGSLFAVRRELAEAKYKALVTMVESFEEEEEPLVVFSCHLIIPSHLARRPGWAMVTGGCSTALRDRAVRSFQDGHLQGIAGTIGAMGVGLTLTRAAHVAFVDRSFVPAENEQAEDRLVRIGQTRGVVVHDLVADHPVDLRVKEILAKKRRLLEGTGLT